MSKRAIVVVAVLLSQAGIARAEEIDWTRTWTVDGGGTRVLSAGTGGSFSFETTVPVNGKDRTLTLSGAPQGRSVTLEATTQGTRGIVGALEGAPEDETNHEVLLELTASYTDDGVLAEARYSVDGQKVRGETWRYSQAGVEILELLTDGKKLAGEFDGKQSTTGLVVKYRVSGSTQILHARVVVADGHPYATFYDGFVKSGERVVAELDLGAIAPGEHELVWDGRDTSVASRIALEGSYKLVLAGAMSASGSQDASADPGLPLRTLRSRAERPFRVAKPRFSAIASDWPAGYGDPGRKRWNGSPDSAVLGGTMEGRGYSSTGPSAITNSAGAWQCMQSSACFMIDTHGEPGSIAFIQGPPAAVLSWSVHVQTTLTNGDLQPASLKDVHWAITNSCHGGADAKGKGTSFVDALVAAGCDVAIGFTAYTITEESTTFQERVVSFVQKGTPIEKAAREAARQTFREYHRQRYFLNTAIVQSDRTDEELDQLIEKARQEMAENELKTRGTFLAACMYVARGAGIPADESFWPPRYGNSRN